MARGRGKPSKDRLLLPLLRVFSLLRKQQIIYPNNGPICILQVFKFLNMPICHMSMIYAHLHAYLSHVYDIYSLARQTLRLTKKKVLQASLSTPFQKKKIFVYCANCIYEYTCFSCRWTWMHLYFLVPDIKCGNSDNTWMTTNWWKFWPMFASWG
jgi:hypothetical protein